MRSAVALRSVFTGSHLLIPLEGTRSGCTPKAGGSQVVNLCALGRGAIWPRGMRPLAGMTHPARGHDAQHLDAEGRPPQPLHELGRAAQGREGTHQGDSACCAGCPSGKAQTTCPDNRTRPAPRRAPWLYFGGNGPPSQPQREVRINGGGYSRDPAPASATSEPRTDLSQGAGLAAPRFAAPGSGKTGPKVPSRLQATQRPRPRGVEPPDPGAAPSPSVPVPVVQAPGIRRVSTSSSATSRSLAFWVCDTRARTANARFESMSKRSIRMP
jgi:hypothetical protein